MKGLGVDFSRDHFIEAVSPENCFIKFPVIIDYFFGKNIQRNVIFNLHGIPENQMFDQGFHCHETLLFRFLPDQKINFILFQSFDIGLSQVHANEFDIIDIVFVHIIGNDISSRI